MGRIVSATRMVKSLQAVPTPRTQVPVGRYQAAVNHVRSQALAQALLGFIVGLSLDDLRILVVPGWLLGVLWATVWIAVGPLVSGRLLARRTLHLPENRFLGRLQLHRRAGSLGLLVVILLGIAWLVVFASGVPPWAA